MQSPEIAEDCTVRRRPTKTPGYCLHRARGQAYVHLNGKDHYLGRYGARESKDAYDLKIAEWLVGGCSLPQPQTITEHADDRPPDQPLVKEVVLAFLEHAKQYYRDRDGTPTSELQNLVDALRPVPRLFAETPSGEFRALSLQAVREEMIRSGLARKTINDRIHRIRRCFRWAASVEKVPAEVVASLETIDALKQGRSSARESSGIHDVPIEVIEATLPHLPPVVAAMVMIQLLTGRRPGEVWIMKGRDLTPGTPNWEYRPAQHKNQWRGQDRVIVLGPKAQEILRPFLRPNLEDYIFSPRRVVAEIYNRQTGKPTPQSVLAPHATRYNRRNYRQAIIRACDKAFPHETISRKQQLNPEQHRELEKWQKAHRWCPLRLRHTRAQEVRDRFGLESSSAVLGHAKMDTILIYESKTLKHAHDIDAAIG
jgi:integrase